MTLSWRTPGPACFRWLLVVATVGLGFRMLPDASVDRLARALRHCDARWAALAALGMVAVMLARVCRMRALLGQMPRPAGPARWVETAPPVFLVHAGNMFLPARAGDALFALLVHRRLDYPVTMVLAVQLADRLAQLLSLWVMAVVAWGLARPGPLLRVPLSAFVGTGLVGLILLTCRNARRRVTAPTAPALEDGSAARLGDRLRRFTDSLRLLRSRAAWFRALAWSCLADTIDVVMIGLCLTAVGVRADPAACLLVLLTINLAVALPSTPGQVGPLEAAAVLSLRAVDVGANEALAFALLYHAAQALPLALLGALSLALARRGGQREDGTRACGETPSTAASLLATSSPGR